MSQFITDGRIDHDDFRRVVGGLVRHATHPGAVRAYGEMVALLWDAATSSRRSSSRSSGTSSGANWSSRFCAATTAHRSRALSMPRRFNRSAISTPPSCAAISRMPGLSRPRSGARFQPRPGDTAARRFVAGALREMEPGRTAAGRRSASGNGAGHERRAPCPLAVLWSSCASRTQLCVSRSTTTAEPSRAFGATGIGPGPAGGGCTWSPRSSRQWGVEATGDGKAVWAELER